MRVYFTGGHGTGKTTLARYVSAQYQLPMITESARMVLSEQELQIDSLRCDLATSNKYQREVFDRQLSEEGQFSSFVSDRSLLDILAYSAQHTGILPELFERPELPSYIEALRAPEAFLFFVRPARATLRPDGVREAINWDGVVAIDAMIKFPFNGGACDII
jgi:predicted ATPase